MIGGYRERFRSKEQGEEPQQKLHGRYIWEYKLGPVVDSSGTLPTGESFDNIHEYKRLLIAQREQVARNLISQLVAYSTGCEIQFADREAIEKILDRCRPSEFGLRSMIHEVIQSELFLNK